MQPDSYRRTSEQLVRRDAPGSVYDKIAQARERREVVLRRQEAEGAPSSKGGAKSDAVLQRYVMRKGADTPETETMAVKTVARAKPAKREPLSGDASLFPPGAPPKRAPAKTLDELQERAADTLVAKPARTDNETGAGTAVNSALRAIAVPLLFGVAIGLAFFLM